MNSERVEVAFVLGMENRKEIFNMKLCKSDSDNIKEMCFLFQYLFDKAYVGTGNAPKGYVSDSVEDISKDLDIPVDKVNNLLRGLFKNNFIKRSERYGLKIF